MRREEVVQSMLYRTEGFVKRNAPTILTCVGAVGVVGTAVMTAKGTTKASMLLAEAKVEKEEELTNLEIIGVALPAYIPAIMFGAATISCIFGANVLNKQHQASLVSAYTLLDQSYKKYKVKVAELYGEEADTKVRHEIAKEHCPRRK